MDPIKTRLQTAAERFTETLVSSVPVPFTPEKVRELATELNIKDILSNKDIPDLGSGELGLGGSSSPFSREDISSPFRSDDDLYYSCSSCDDDQLSYVTGFQEQTDDEQREDLSIERIWEELLSSFPGPSSDTNADRNADQALGQNKTSSPTTLSPENDEFEPEILLEIVTKRNFVSIGNDDDGYEPEMLFEKIVQTNIDTDDSGSEPEMLFEKFVQTNIDTDDSGYEPEMLFEKVVQTNIDTDDSGYEPEMLFEKVVQTNIDTDDSGYEPEMLFEKVVQSSMDIDDSGYEPEMLFEKVVQNVDTDDGGYEPEMLLEKVVQISMDTDDEGYEPEMLYEKVVQSSMDIDDSGYEPEVLHEKKVQQYFSNGDLEEDDYEPEIVQEVEAEVDANYSSDEDYLQCLLEQKERRKRVSTSKTSDESWLSSPTNKTFYPLKLI